MHSVAGPSASPGPTQADRNLKLRMQLAPQDLEAERCVLGSIMIDGGCLDRIVPILMPEDFYRADYGELYRLLLSLRGGGVIDLMTVTSAMADEGLTARLSSAMLAEMMNAVPTAVHAVHYARLVQSASRRRALISVAGRISAIGYEERDADIAEERALGVLREAIGRRNSLARSTSR